jgi:acetyl/propionyl-CoA carboxylase alpha subunit/acetyl-CoA carboxylase beta subunit
MGKISPTGDELYLTSESVAEGFSRFPQKETESTLKGVLELWQIERQLELLKVMDVDAYVEAVIQPVEDQSRPGARAILKALGGKFIEEVDEGPFYSVILELDFDGRKRKIGIIAQDRNFTNGQWMPEHHELAAKKVSEYSKRSLPIVTFMDTIGADAGEVANKNNQAHCISRLIAELCNVDVPTVGIIIGQGYSGGAIPLASSNILLCLRSGVFNTIHPKGLASINQRYNLSWQECAKFVGVSPSELYKQGNIDGIIDYEPGEEANLGNLRDAIISSILSVEDNAREFVSKSPEIIKHYQRNVDHYLNISDTMAAVHASSALKFSSSPTEYPSIFGVTYRYQRYLGLRKRIKSTTTTQYGRLSVEEIPKGQLAERANRERRTGFLHWLQDPDRILYDDLLSKSWKSYLEKKAEIDDERGRIAQFIFGEPRKNYEDAKKELCLNYGLHLYNRWKGGAQDNLEALIDYLQNYQVTRYLLKVGDIKDARGLLGSMAEAQSPFIKHVRGRFSYEGKKLFDKDFVSQKSEAFLFGELITEFNLIIEGPSLYDSQLLLEENIAGPTRELSEAANADQVNIEINRRLLEETLWSYIERRKGQPRAQDDSEMTILDVVLDDGIREDFVVQAQNLLVFGDLYDSLITNLVEVARQAHESKILEQSVIKDLVTGALEACSARPALSDLAPEVIAQQFADWIEYFAGTSRGSSFLKSVEEWKKIVHPDTSDTLFVIVSFICEKLLPEYYQAEAGTRKYEGRVVPIRIGRRKDFWNRLTIAYRDLLIQEILGKEKSKKRTTVPAIVDRFFTGFEETNETMMTADPVNFPTLRPSIESALKKGVTPCGTITGIGNFKLGAESEIRVGVVISNLDFQVGCMDMAGCEKICKLMVDCSRQRLPVICFISSGGMQTKEGPSVLFAMPILNDRFTRFIRDNDLPVIVFGFGDCTGGAQASYVTHPLAQTYYFSGTDMPFAGQKVVESNLPSTSTLSNYLSLTPGAMQGLVKHPFAEDLDEELRGVDPAIPLPTETVEEVVDRIMAGTLTAASVPKLEPIDVPKVVREVNKILIHARGCTAVKLVRKAQEIGLEIVLVQSDPDMDSVPADMVGVSPRDRVVCIGGNTSDESYLNALSVLRIAEDEGVDSLHPGIGFLSEDPNFARLCIDRGINFIGPMVSSMETMGNKSNAISTTMGIGVPVVPGSHGIVNTAERAAEVADQIGYPVLIKAVHGGGGKGIQVVKKPEQIHGLFHQVTAEARNAFGNGDIYLEKFVISLRHIEVQILRDTQGNTRILGLRDCSVQRNNQKLMEESGSTILSKEHKKAVFEYAEKIADAVDYHGAGTVEFIYDVPNNSVYFMEMNTRLQVEHPVTEVVTGIDIVKAQFDIASGRLIKDLGIKETGYALEVRVNAEKAVLDADGGISFQPTPGEITECELPEEPHLQLISMAAAGKIVSPFYDNLIIQIVCWGSDRIDAINKMRVYLDKVTIHGICTNISLIKKILGDEQFIDGEYDTDYLPQFLARTDSAELINEIEEASGIAERTLDLESLKIEGSDEIKVVSPSTAVFYLTPSPSEPEYVAVGDILSTEQILCQLEAMKMFTPMSLSSFSSDGEELYPSNQQYRMVRINMASAQQVNEGDLLFVIEPVQEPSADKEPSAD